jgi:predicted RNA-binding protein with PIN domain
VFVGYRELVEDRPNDRIADRIADRIVDDTGDVDGETPDHGSAETAGTDGTAETTDEPVEHRYLRSAIEYSVAMAEELAKRRRSFRYPSELKRYFGSARIPSGSLGRLRRAIEADDDFRTTVAVGAVPDLVDPIGVLWLSRPDGWHDSIVELVATERARQDDVDLRAQLRRAQRRRVAAERAAVRQQAHLAELQTALRDREAEVDRLRAELVDANEALTEARSEIVDVRNEIRHARDREAAAVARLDAALGDRRDEAVADDADDAVGRTAVDPGELAALVGAARAGRAAADRIDAFVAAHGGVTALAAPVEETPVVDVRRPIRLPGGTIATSREAAEFLVRSDAAVVVDGYNVAMLGWPQLGLVDQRERLLAGLENLSRRFGTDVSVVFDGAEVVGAHAARRREVRVVYSPAGVTADDVIRDEVARLPPTRSVVVVTNDAEIVRDVRAVGANTVPSNALLAVL